MAKKSRGAGATSAGGVNNIIQRNSGPQTVKVGLADRAALRLRLRSNKPKPAKIGGAKGMYRKVDDGYKRRKFTVQQRRTFRARRGPKSTQGNGPR